MNRRIRRPTTKTDEASYLKYLKPGALAQLRDSRINARSHRIDSQSQISLHRTQSPSSSPVRFPQPAQITSDSFPCFAGRIYGPRCPQRKKLVAAKSFFLPPASPVSDSPDPIIDLFSTDFLLAH